MYVTSFSLISLAYQKQKQKQTQTQIHPTNNDDPFVASLLPSFLRPFAMRDVIIFSRESWEEEIMLLTGGRSEEVQTRRKRKRGRQPRAVAQSMFPEPKKIAIAICDSD